MLNTRRYTYTQADRIGLYSLGEQSVASREVKFCGSRKNEESDLRPTFTD